jgi:hypothetical protein
MKRIIAAGAAAALATIGFAGTAVAGPPAGAGEGGKPQGIQCQQLGISVLQETGALTLVAQGGLAFPIDEAGEPTDDAVTYSFSEVLNIHRTAPATANVVLKAYAPILLPEASMEELAAVAAAVDVACPA